MRTKEAAPQKSRFFVFCSSLCNSRWVLTAVEVVVIALRRAPAMRVPAQGKGYAMRKQYCGHDIYVPGFSTSAGARKAVRGQLTTIDKN